MKIHNLMVEQVSKAVKEIFSGTRHADKVIEFYLKNNKKWGARDRRFFAESVYDLVRHWRLYWYLADFPDSEYRDGEAMSLSQVRRVWAVYWFLKTNDKLDWPEFKNLNLESLEKKKMEVPTPAISLSFADEIFQLGLNEWGRDWPAIAESVNHPAEVYLRTNTLKTDRKSLITRLASEQIEALPVEDSEVALKLRERKNVFITKAFKEGLFEVQDIGSQKIAPLLQVEPGQRVIDACAGAGGKTLHLAALMKNKGRIIAMDVHERKLEELKRRTRRNGVDIVETRWIENTKVIKRLEGSADRVLLDVPCSGMGVLKRNPDTKWKLTLEDVDRLHQLQSDILMSYSNMTKVGGLLVYATCSLLPSENENQVKAFLEKKPTQWEEVERISLRPDQYPGDGFFASLLRRKA